MEDRFLQQLKKGVLEMLVLKLVCTQPAYGYELLTGLKEVSQGRFVLKEGTLYPILYRLEDDGFIAAKWSAGTGRTTPKKIYEATESGQMENIRRQLIWRDFEECVDILLQGGSEHD